MSNKNFNLQGFEPKNINIEGFECYEKGALFFSFLAYPEADYASARGRFWRALCRWSLSRFTSAMPQMRALKVRAGHYVEGEKSLQTSFERGLRQLQYRVTTAQFVAIPLLKSYFELVRSPPSSISSLLDETRWNLTEFGWKPDSDSNSTAKTKLWKPARPVIHAALAFATCARMCLSPEEDGHIRLQDAIQLCLWDESALAGVVALSEAFRAVIPSVEKLRIQDYELLAFSFASDPQPCGEFHPS